MRRSCPQMPIRKYIGISIASQKRKKRNRSSETKTPITPVSSTSSEMKKPCTRWSIDFQDASIAIGVRNVVSSTRNRLMPSTPR